MVKRSDYIEPVPQVKERVKEARIFLENSYGASISVGQDVDGDLELNIPGQTLSKEGVSQVIDVLTDIHKIMED